MDKLADIIYDFPDRYADRWETIMNPIKQGRVSARDDLHFFKLLNLTDGTGNLSWYEISRACSS